MPAIGYVRISTDRQTEQVSLEAQEAKIRGKGLGSGA
jgi:DNA invertase Pin-like site-specific DNA recombinase